MGNKYTESQKRAILNYQKDKVKIQLLVTPEKREEYRRNAAEQNKSLHQYIIERIEGRC